MIQFRTPINNQFHTVIESMRSAWMKENRFTAWMIIYGFYVSTPFLSYRMISNCLGIPLSTIAYRAKRDKWVEARLSFNDRVIKKVYGENYRASREKKCIHKGKQVYISQYKTSRFDKEISKERRLSYCLERRNVNLT